MPSGLIPASSKPLSSSQWQRLRIPAGSARMSTTRSTSSVARGGSTPCSAASSHTIWPRPGTSRPERPWRGQEEPGSPDAGQGKWFQRALPEPSALLPLAPDDRGLWGKCRADRTTARQGGAHRTQLQNRGPAGARVVFVQKVSGTNRGQHDSGTFRDQFARQSFRHYMQPDLAVGVGAQAVMRDNVLDVRPGYVQIAEADRGQALADVRGGPIPAH